MPKYDFLIVGAGLFGATCARLLTDKGYKCLIIERAKYVGGLAKTYRENDIDIHAFGPHIFHTNNDEVWYFVNQYANFNDYMHTELCMYKDEIYNFPVNMNTFNKIYDDVHFPKEAKHNVDIEIKSYNIGDPQTFEEKCVVAMGFSAYLKTIKGYIEKLWGMPANKIEPDMLNDMIVSYSYDNRYYIDKYQGIPDEGYTKFVENIIGDDIDIMLNKDFLSDRDRYMQLAKYVIYTGPIDAFCKYIYGPLGWRTVRYDVRNESASTNNVLGTAVVNITDPDNETLQLIEHKWFTPYRDTEKYINTTYVSYAYAEKWDPTKIPMYAVNTPENIELFNKYNDFVNQNFNNVIFGGRQGMYSNISMGEAIELAMHLCSQL